MICAGGIGLGAGLLPARAGGRAERWVLAAYALVTGLAFGLFMNLWFWPFLGDQRPQRHGLRPRRAPDREPRPLRPLLPRDVARVGPAPRRAQRRARRSSPARRCCGSSGAAPAGRPSGCRSSSTPAGARPARRRCTTPAADGEQPAVTPARHRGRTARTTTLVTGPVRSGKSRHAEDLLAGPRRRHLRGDRAARPTRPTRSGAGASRAHRARRPESWRTVETTDVAARHRRRHGAGARRLPRHVAHRRSSTTPGGTTSTRRPRRCVVRATGSSSHSARQRFPSSSSRTRSGGRSCPRRRPAASSRTSWAGSTRSSPRVAARVHLVVAGRVVDLSDAPVVPRRAEAEDPRCVTPGGSRRHVHGVAGRPARHASTGRSSAAPCSSPRSTARRGRRSGRGSARLSTTGWAPAGVVAVLALVVTALLSRALHLDGLADLADGLTSGHDPARSLEVMRRGDTGPAGAAALVLVLLLDAACLAVLLGSAAGTALAVVALVASRLACAVCARDGIPPARPEGSARAWRAPWAGRAWWGWSSTSVAVARAVVGAWLSAPCPGSRGGRLRSAGRRRGARRGGCGRRDPAPCRAAPRRRHRRRHRRSRSRSPSPPPSSRPPSP